MLTIYTVEYVYENGQNLLLGIFSDYELAKELYNRTQGLVIITTFSGEGQLAPGEYHCKNIVDGVCRIGEELSCS